MNFKKTFTVLSILFLSLSCSLGTSKEKGNTLLWKISGNGLQKTSYLFGTHHLISISFLDSIPGIYAAFDETDQTVGELDLGDLEAMQTKIVGEAIMPPTVSYETLLPPGDITLLDSALRAIVGFGFDQFKQFKPAMLTNMISISLYQRYYPSATSEENLDQYFQTEALKRSRPVLGLETVEDQVYLLLNAQTPERQAELLICMVKHPELLKKQMDELQAAYHAQDIDALLLLKEKEIPNDPCPSTDEENEAINGDRNRKWLEKLPAIMEEKSSFIAVGCLHLVGEEGLIEGLRKQGYHVEAVK